MATSSADGALDLAGVDVVAGWPRAVGSIRPNSTLVNERFIALHMMIDRMMPELRRAPRR